LRVFNLILYVALLALFVVMLYYADRSGVAERVEPATPPVTSAPAPGPAQPSPAQPSPEQPSPAPAPAPPAAQPPQQRVAITPPPPAPLPEDDVEIGGPPLPGPSEFDEEVWVALPFEVGPQTGTAFTIDEGVWMTARHVVDGCARIGLVVADESGVLASGVTLAEDSDLAIVRAPLETPPLAVDLDETRRRLGDAVYMIGYPQGLPGEVAGKLLGREVMQIRGRYMTREPVLAWAETSRTRGISGTLGGISGGPAFDRDGEIIGVTVAEAPRRGRIYTAAPSSLTAALATAAATPDAGAARVQDLSEASYGLEGRRLRRELRVAKVQCLVE
jgi:S1-C subfamily serine protease